VAGELVWGDLDFPRLLLIVISMGCGRKRDLGFSAGGSAFLLDLVLVSTGSGANRLADCGGDCSLSLLLFILVSKACGANLLTGCCGCCVSRELFVLVSTGTGLKRLGGD